MSTISARADPSSAPGSSAVAEPRWATPWLLAFCLVCFSLVWATSFHPGYGYFHDELDYIACAKRLAAGYVDHPPLAPWILAGNRMLFGDSLPAMRVLPALCGVATALLAAHMARALGARAAGQLLAALCVVAAPVLLFVFSIFSTNCFEILLWTLAFFVLLRLGRDDDDRLWPVVGSLLGLAVLSKHTSVTLAAAIGLAVTLSPMRRHLRGRHLWLGVGIGALLVLPNLVWQVQHDWASLDFYTAVDRQGNVATSPLVVLADQFGSFNPGAFPVWAAGLWFLLVSARGRRHRLVGWTVGILFAALLIAGKSRPDRIMGVYPVLFAAGAAQLDGWVAGRTGRGPRLLLPLIALAVAAIGIAVAPLGLPILSPERAARYAAALGDENDIQREVGASPLLLPLAHRMGSRELVMEVERVYAALAPGERDDALILASGYPAAGAIELLGGDRLPPVYSPHVTYYFWGPPKREPALVIGVGYEAGQLAPYFERVSEVARASCPYCMGWRQDVPIALARGARPGLREAWPRLRLKGLPARKLYLLERSER